MTSVSGLQSIAPVPTASDFIDVVLNMTMRKTPTVIHKNVSAARASAKARAGSHLEDIELISLV